MSTQPSHLIARSSLKACALAVFTAIGMIAGNAGTANAAKPRPPVVIPAVPNVPPPAGVQIISVSSTGAFVTETPNSGYVVATRYVSGPIPPFDYVVPIWGIAGKTAQIGGLVPNSSYVFEMRRFSINGQLVTSGWTRFSFRTTP